MTLNTTENGSNTPKNTTPKTPTFDELRGAAREYFRDSTNNDGWQARLIDFKNRNGGISALFWQQTVTQAADTAGLAHFQALGGTFDEVNKNPEGKKILDELIGYFHAEAVKLEVLQKSGINRILTEAEAVYNFENPAEAKNALEKALLEHVPGSLKYIRTKALLTEVLGKVPETKKEFKKLLELVTEQQLQAMSPKNKELLRKVRTKKRLPEDEYLELYGALPDSSRKKLIDIYAPFITLGTLVDAGVVKAKNANEIAENLITRDLNLNDEEAEALKKIISPSDFDEIQIHVSQLSDASTLSNQLNPKKLGKFKTGVLGVVIASKIAEELEPEVAEEAVGKETLKQANEKFGKETVKKYFQELPNKLRLQGKQFSGVESLSDEKFLNGTEFRYLSFTKNNPQNGNIKGYIQVRYLPPNTQANKTTIPLFEVTDLGLANNQLLLNQGTFSTEQINELDFYLRKSDTINVHSTPQSFANERQQDAQQQWREIEDDDIHLDENDEEVVAVQDQGRKFEAMFEEEIEELRRHQAETEVAIAGEQVAGNQVVGSQEQDENANALITNLNQLNEKLRANCGDETFYELAVGASFTIGNPGDRNEHGSDFNIFRVTQVEKGIQITDGINTEPLGGTFSYSDFYTAAINGNFHTIPPLINGESFLSYLKTSIKEKEEYSDLRYDSEHKCLVEADRKYSDDPDGYKGIKYLFGSEYAVEIIELSSNEVKIVEYSNFKEGDEKKPSTGDKGAEYTTSYERLAFLIQSRSLVPNNTTPPIEATPFTGHTKHGRLKHLMANLSFHDIFGGGKKFIEAFKHKLEHGNHLQEARVMNMMAKAIGIDKWDYEFYTEFKAKYETEEKKLIQERVELLSNMGGPDRQKAVLASLLNDGTHDYDHWTNAIAMLEKHGTLYAGVLKKYENEWLFYKRIRGLPLDAKLEDDPEIQRIRKELIANREPLTEEAFIREFMKKGKLANGQLFPNSLVWNMVKKGWNTGTEGEKENGAKEAKLFRTSERRLSYFFDKLKDKEYPHAIGAYEEFLNKNPGSETRHLPAFVLAMTRAPERINQSILQEFVKTYDKGHLHSPALMYIETPAKQEDFHNIVGTLCKINDERVGNGTMYSEFMTMLKHARNKDAWDGYNDEQKLHENPPIAAAQKFWEKYGAILQPQLTINASDPVVLARKDTNPVLKQYYDRVTSQQGDTNFNNGDEIDNGTYFTQTGSSALLTQTDKVIEKLGFRGGTENKIATERLDSKYRDLDFIPALRKVRDSKVLTLGEKKAIFRHLYTEFMKKAINSTDVHKLVNSLGVIAQMGFGVPEPDPVGLARLNLTKESLDEYATRRNGSTRGVYTHEMLALSGGVYQDPGMEKRFGDLFDQFMGSKITTGHLIGDIIERAESTLGNIDPVSDGHSQASANNPRHDYNTPQ